MALTLTQATVDSEPVPFTYLDHDGEIWFVKTGKRSDVDAAQFITRILDECDDIQLILRRICELAEIDWRRRAFFEIQTYVGYHHLGPGCCDIQKLEVVLKNGCLCVNDWKPVLPQTHQSSRFENLRSLDGLIPPEIIEAFEPVIK